MEGWPSALRYNTPGFVPDVNIQSKALTENGVAQLQVAQLQVAQRDLIIFLQETKELSEPPRYC